jgi:ATP-dependent Zn protease
VDLPNKDERLAYIRTKLKEHGCNVNELFLDTLAKRSVGMNYGNLNHVIDKAIREAKLQHTPITEQLLDDALETILFGEKKSWGVEYSERTAWHEAGHAYMNWKSGQTPEYITITARGNFGGYVMPASTEEKPMYTKKEILDQVKVCLAGRAAEILRYGWEDGLSTGAMQDLQQAGELITDYICSYSMDDQLGLVYLPNSGEIPAEIRNRIHELMTQMLKAVVEELRIERRKMEEFVNQLMRNNKLMSYEIHQILTEVK